MPSPAGLSSLVLEAPLDLVRFAPDLAAVAVLLVLAALTGLVPVRKLRPAAPDAELFLATTLGLALLGTGAGALALAGLFRPPLLAALLSLAAAPGALALARGLRALRCRRRRVALLPLATGLALVVTASLPALVVALYPATGYDGTAYHLPLAARIAASGSLAPLESIRYWWFPQLNEVLFALVMSVGSARTAQVLGVALFALGGLGGFALARRASGLGAGLLAAAAWLAMPLAAENAWGASVDATLALFAVAGALALQVFLERGRAGWCILAAALFGAGTGIKYFGTVYAGAAALLVAVHAARVRRPSLVAVFVGTALLAGGFWYARTWVLVGNPLYPAMTSVFGNHGPYTDREVEWLSSSMSAWFGCPRSPGEVLALPLEAVKWPSRLSESGIGLHPAFPVLLAAASGALLRRRRQAVPLALALAGLATSVATLPVLRFALPAVALVCAAGSVGLANALRLALGRGAAARVPALLGAATLILPPGTLAWAGWALLQRGPVPKGTREERAYLERRLPGTGALALLNRERGQDHTVFALGCDNLAFYSEGRFFATPFGPGATDRVLPAGATAGEVRSNLAVLGATHVLICPRASFGERWRALGAPSWAVRIHVPSEAELYAIDPGLRPAGAAPLTPRRVVPIGSASASPASS